MCVCVVHSLQGKGSYTNMKCFWIFGPFYLGKVSHFIQLGGQADLYLAFVLSGGIESTPGLHGAAAFASLSYEITTTQGMGMISLEAMISVTLQL